MEQLNKNMFLHVYIPAGLVSGHIQSTAESIKNQTESTKSQNGEPRFRDGSKLMMVPHRNAGSQVQTKLERHDLVLPTPSKAFHKFGNKVYLLFFIFTNALHSHTFFSFLLVHYFFTSWKLRERKRRNTERDGKGKDSDQEDREHNEQAGHVLKKKERLVQEGQRAHCSVWC